MSSPTRPSRVGKLIGLVLLAWMAGCETTPQVDPSGRIDLEDLVRHQNERATLLRLLESGGTIELRRETEDGSSFDDCALDLCLTSFAPSSP